MKPSRLILALLLLALFAGGLAWCFAERRAAERAAAAEPAVGMADGSGNLVLHVFSPGAKNPDVAVLTTDYGVVMYRSREHGAQFVLGDRARKSVREFGNYEDFVAALSELPRESVLTIYDRCTVPRFYDFYPVHDELYFKFKSDCTKKRVRIADMPRITCTCGQAQ